MKPCVFVLAVWCATVAFFGSQSTTADEPSQKEEKPQALAEVKKLHGKVTFTIEDGEALNREFPDTFWIPPKARRESLVKGDLVKLVFNLTDGDDTQGERMWVIVEGRDRAEYFGVLDNDPLSTDQIKAGHRVSFQPRHVIDIYEPEVIDEKPAEPSDAADSR